MFPELRIGAADSYPRGYDKLLRAPSIKIKSVTSLPQNEQERVLSLVVETTVAVQGPPWREGGPKYGPPTGPADALVVEPPFRASSSDNRNSLDPDNRAKRSTLKSVSRRSSKSRDRSSELQADINLLKIRTGACPKRSQSHSCRRHKVKSFNKTRSPARVHDSSRRKTERPVRDNIEVPEIEQSNTPLNQEESSEIRISENNLSSTNNLSGVSNPPSSNLSWTNNLSWRSNIPWTNDVVWTNNVESVNTVLVNQGEWIVRCPPYQESNIIRPKRLGKFSKILDNSNEAIKDVNKKVMAMAKAMTPTWSLRLLGVSCGSVVCAWGLLLILSVLGGATHNTGIGSFGLGTLAEDNVNGARCPWACTCRGQELECSHRGLTQVPGDLAALLLAEKL